MRKPVPITVAEGDGIGPEIMAATLQVLQAAGAAITPEPIVIGEQVYRTGQTAGINPEAWESLRRTRVFLKAPITTPQGGGVKSLNVTVRKTLGLFANVRPVRAYAPYVPTKHPQTNLVIIRENEEDLYAGIEHQQTADMVQTLKLYSRPGIERIVRYAFEYARANGRKRVTCFTKDNIMKLTDGLFHRIFDEIGGEYPDIVRDHWIVDIGMAKIADSPEAFDVILLPNLYGDIASDVAAQIAGSVGLAPSVNIGDGYAMFEAIHGSAPDIAGQGIANPSGLLLAAVMMLVHIGQPDVAERIHNAWLCTVEDGILTPDLAKGGEAVSTRHFTAAIVARLGQVPRYLTPASYQDARPVPIKPPRPRPVMDKTLQGVDVFLDELQATPAEIGRRLETVAGNGLHLSFISNRGVKVYPDGLPETFCTDHWRCRFERDDDAPLAPEDLLSLLARIGDAGLQWVKLENLYCFDGKPGYSLGQGQ